MADIGVGEGRARVGTDDLRALRDRDPFLSGLCPGWLLRQRPAGGIGVLLGPCDLARSSPAVGGGADRKSTRLNSSHVAISYAVFCWKKKTNRGGRKTDRTSEWKAERE